MQLKRNILLVVVIFVSLNLNAQFKLPQFSISGSSVCSSGEHVPFWIISNQYGIYSEEKFQFLTRMSAIADYDTSKTIDYYYGFDGIARVDKKMRIFPSQAYLGAKVGFIDIVAGIKNEYYGTQDSFLSLGGFIYSGNSQSIPRVSLRTIDYVKLPYTLGLLEVKFGISHGWLGDSMQYVKNAWIHDKYAFLRIKLTSHFKAFVGIQHIAEWGGTSIENSVGELPSGIKDFWSVFLAKQSDNTSNLPDNEALNRYGNHIASYNFGLEFDNNDLFLKFYWQTMLEDKNGRVGIDWKNSQDGLWGLSFRNKNKGFLNNVVFEYFNSTNQSGDLNKSGGDNYYNNFVYKSGWTYYGMVIGTPVITSPAFNHSRPFFVVNNRVRAFHLGFASNVRTIVLKGKFTYTQNYGGPNDYPLGNFLSQLYSSMTVDYCPAFLKRTLISGTLAMDYGKLLGNNMGLLFTYKKHFN